MTIGGQKIRNLLSQSDSFTLKIDFVICCLQEMGAMSFLRAERILNSYLGKNKLTKREVYPTLYSLMQSTLQRTSKNKLLSEMTNFDSCNIDSYQKDIFYNPGAVFSKIEELFSNLYGVMTLEILSSLEGLRDLLSGNLNDLKFVNKEMNEEFTFLTERISPWDKEQSLTVIQHHWH